MCGVYQGVPCLWPRGSWNRLHPPPPVTLKAISRREYMYGYFELFCFIGLTQMYQWWSFVSLFFSKVAQWLKKGFLKKKTLLGRKMPTQVTAFLFLSAQLNHSQQMLKDPAFRNVRTGVCDCVCVRVSESVHCHSIPSRTRLIGQIAIYLQSAGSAHSASLISRPASYPMKGRRELKSVFVLVCCRLFSLCELRRCLSSWLTVCFCSLVSSLLLLYSVWQIVVSTKHCVLCKVID